MTSAPAIGSVLPFPVEEAAVPRAQSLWSHWTGDRPAAPFRTARAALAALLRARRIGRLWLPAYACPALAEAAAAADASVAWYDLDATLAVDSEGLARGLRLGDAALVIAYFGRSPSPEVQALAQSHPQVLWIEDRAQALAPDGLVWAEATLYSPRKLIGVPDGGLVVGGGALPAPQPAPPIDATAQRARLADPEGRDTERWYAAFQAQEAALDARPFAMSDITRGLLERIDPAPLAARRRENYAMLAQALSAYALWPDAAVDFAPLAFPVRVRDRDEVVRRMAVEGIYCPRHWPDLPSPAAEFAAVHALNAELLSIPCDHRYGAGDMARVAERLKATARPA
jgi:hypothetical protein